jgi:uncharacterized protein involved in exopolysaccharide biosynthesis
MQVTDETDRGAPMDNQASGFSKRDLAYLAFKQLRLIVTVFIVTSLLTTLSAYIFPRLYEARAILSVKRNIPPIPGASPEVYRLVLDLKEVQNSEIQFIKSRAVLETAADYLLAKEMEARARAVPLRGLKGFVRDMISNVKSVMIATGLVDEGSPREDMIDFLMRKITAKPLPISDLIDVSIETKNGERSAETVNAVTRAYLNERVKMFRRPGVYEYFDEQVTVTKKKLESLENDLQDLKLKADLTSDEDQQRRKRDIALKLAELSTLNSELKRVRADKEDLDRKIQAIEAQIESRPTSATGMDSPGKDPEVNRLEKQLLDLETERARALVRFSPQSREIIEIDGKIARIRESLKEASAIVMEPGAVAPEDTRQDLEPALYRARADLEATRISETTLGEQISSLKDELQQNNRYSLDIARLEEVVASTEKVYFEYAKQLEEARAAEATNSNATNVYVVHYAAVPDRPKYSRLLLISLGVAIGFFIACGAALVNEYLDQTLNNTHDVETYLGLPLLASFPVSRDIYGQSGSSRG